MARLIKTPTRQKQQGVALIIVLLIVALVSILATEMGSRLQLQVKRASNIKDNNQAYWYAMGAEQFAHNVIKRLIEKDPDVINLEQNWQEPVAYPLEGGGIEANLKDMQACFNLNAVRQESESDGNGGRNANPTDDPSDAMNAFHRLLTLNEVDSYSADTLRDSLTDWLDSDSRMRDYGAEDSEYESRPHPYLAANGMMASKSELRLVNGVNMEWLAKILPYVCVIPGSEELKINVNTLTEDQAPVLAALTGLSVNEAGDVIASRSNKGFTEAADFLSESRITGANLNDVQKGWFDVKTQYFILDTKTRYNNATFRMSSVFRADGDNISVIRREFGGVY